MRFATIAGISAIAFCSLLVGQAEAQYPSRYSPPAGPVLPNALNYFRRDVGLLDPYNTFVEPRRQLNQQLNYLEQLERNDYRRTQAQIGQLRQSLAAPTGSGAGFMNHGPYFNVRQTQRTPGR
jgi:hypothetical protein